MKINELDVKVAATKAWSHIVAEYGLDMNPAMKELVTYAEKVRRDCQPYLQQIHRGQKLWRGLDGLEGFILKKARLGNRRPTDTGDSTHELLNTMFVEELGKPYRNAVFATGDENVAGGYGRLYQIFPINDFSFAWSKQIRDLWVSTRQLRLIDRYHLSHPDATAKKIQTLKLEEIEKTKDEVISTYQETELAAAIQDKKEIMIMVPTYYAINFNDIIFAYRQQTGHNYKSHSHQQVFHRIIHEK